MAPPILFPVKKLVAITPEMARAIDAYRFDHRIKTEAEANSIIGELEKGADFAELATKHSTDPGASSGGDLGYFGHDDMVKIGTR